MGGSKGESGSGNSCGIQRLNGKQPAIQAIGLGSIVFVFALPCGSQVAGGFAKSMGWQWGMWAPGIIGMAVGIMVLLLCK